MKDTPIGICWHCGHPLGKADLGRETTCQGCGKATRCCRNCRLYAPGRPLDCIEPIAEPVTDKTRANFCEHFDPTTRPVAGEPAQAHAAELFKAAQDLFK
jgi:hypothetical protein